MIIRILEQKTLTKNISCKCKCKSDGIKCDSNQKWNNDKCQCECKDLKGHHVCRKDNIWNPESFTKLLRKALVFM